MSRPAQASPSHPETAAGAAPPWAVLLAIMLLAFWLRMQGLGEVSLRGDEAFSVTFSRQGLGEVWRTLLLTEPHPPLYYTLLHVWMGLAGQSELAVRYLSVFFGLLTVPVTYRLGAFWSGSRLVGSVAALLVAVNPYLVWHSQDARMYSMLAALCAASLYLGLRLAGSRQGGPGRGAGGWAGCVLVTAAALYTHYGALFALAGQGAAALVVWGLAGWGAGETGRRLRPAQRWPAAMAAAFACFLPWAYVAAPMMLGHTKGWIAEVTLADLARRSLEAYSLGVTAGGQAATLAPVFLLALAIGSLVALRQAPAALAVAWASVLVPLGLAFAISLGRPMFDERYYLFVVPAYAVLLAWGAGAFRSAPAEKPSAGLWLLRAAAAAAIVLALAASACSLNNYYTAPEYAKSPGWRELAASIVSRTQPGDRVVQNYPDPSLPYYLDGRLPLDGIPSSGPLQEGPTERQLAQAVSYGGRLWFLPYDSPGWDESGYVEKWLDTHATRLSDETVGGIRLELYDTRAGAGGGR